ncbi:MAG: thiol:disulfide interchange protein DsbA/DsbL [Gammaproteobacteria bacterium]
MAKATGRNKLYGLRRAVFAAVAVFAAAAMPFAAAAQTAPKAGTDYIALDPPLAVRAPADKIEVVEFFNFSCPHCFRMQGAMARWERDFDLSDIALVRQPVVFQAAAGHYARMFHTLEAMGIAEEYYGKVFDAIHRDRRLLNSRGRFADWLEDNGLDGGKAEEIYDSFSVNTKVARANRIADDYGINSTPQFAVAGKYLLTPTLSGSLQKMLDTASALIETERAARR